MHRQNTGLHAEFGDTTCPRVKLRPDREAWWKHPVLKKLKGTSSGMPCLCLRCSQVCPLPLPLRPRLKTASLGVGRPSVSLQV